MFIHLFVLSFIFMFLCKFVHSFICSFVRLFVRSFVYLHRQTKRKTLGILSKEETVEGVISGGVRHSAPKERKKRERKRVGCE